MFTDHDDYSDIIHLPHHQSTTHPPMPMAKRAAQFASVTSFVSVDQRDIAENAQNQHKPTGLQWIHDPDVDQTDTWIE